MSELREKIEEIIENSNLEWDFSEEFNRVVDELEALLPQWKDIESAPKDMTEIMGWREDAGAMLIRWTAPNDFLTESELEELDGETAEAEDWFYADFVTGGRLEGSEAPTHWMPLPQPPKEG